MLLDFVKDNKQTR